MTESFPHTSLLTAFLAGLLSFASPCVLPLVPSYLMYITGLSLEQLSDSTERQRRSQAIVANSCLFIAGFSIVFIAFGASASAVGRLLTDYQDFIRKVGAGTMVLFGLHLMGLVTLSWFMMEKRVHLRSRPVGYLGSMVIGATFAAGWTPCVGPLLGSMLLFASMSDTLRSIPHSLWDRAVWKFAGIGLRLLRAIRHRHLLGPRGRMRKGKGRPPALATECRTHAVCYRGWRG